MVGAKTSGNHVELSYFGHWRHLWFCLAQLHNVATKLIYLLYDLVLMLLLRDGDHKRP